MNRDKNNSTYINDNSPFLVANKNIALEFDKNLRNSLIKLNGGKKEVICDYTAS